MKNIYRVSFIAAAALVLTLTLSLNGCASTPASQSASQTGPRSKTVTLNLKNSSIDEISNQLSQVKSSQVTVSTRSLKSLIVSQKTLQNECRNLSSQLEALKSLDVEEYESHE